MARSASNKQGKRRGRKAIVSDRISSLPDSLLHHILSFLPTKEVVATSLLSKRWKSLWLSMTTFDFDNATFTFSPHFFRFVDAVLFMVDSKPVEKFLLRCDSLNFWYDIERVGRINVWINTLILRRKVEHLELCCKDYCLEVTSRIFNCDTIRVLKIDGVEVNSFYSVNLPSLKVMHLVDVTFPDSKGLANLLSRCHLLQELVLLSPILGNYEVTLDMEKFQHLVSATVPFRLIKWKAFTNVTFLRLNSDSSSGFDFPRFENLTRIEFSILYDRDLNWIVREGLRNCPKLEILVIDEIFVPSYGKRRSKKPILDVPQCVSSHLKEFRLGGYEGLELQFEFVKFIMKNARVLRTISICSTSQPLKEKYQMIQRLSSCPRGSENCQLFFR